MPEPVKPSGTSNHYPSRLRLITFALIPLCVLLLLLELALRLSGKDFSIRPLEIEYIGTNANQRFASHLNRDYFTFDSETIWAPRIGAGPFNESGFRGAELAMPKPNGEFRILAVGDSNTLGHTSAWPNELSTLLDPATLGFDSVGVINAGVYGFTSYQGRLHLPRFLSFEPDLVLISFGGNEPSLNRRPDKAYIVPNRPWLFRVFNRKSAILNSIEYLGFRQAVTNRDNTNTEPESAVPRVSPPDFEDDLEEMIETARAAGARVILLTRPQVADFHTGGRETPGQVYYEAMFEVTLRLDVGIIDVDRMANHSWSLFQDHSHFNTRGHRLIAEYLARAIPQVLEHGSYDSDELRFKPRFDSRLRDLVGFKPRIDYEELVMRLEKDESIAAVQPYFILSDETSLSNDLVDGEVVELRPSGTDTPGAVCVTQQFNRWARTYRGIDLSHPHLLWVETTSRSDTALRIFWTSESRFLPDASVSSIYYREGRRETGKFVHVLPAGTSALRVSQYIRHWRGDVCLDEVRLAPILAEVGELSPEP